MVFDQGQPVGLEVLRPVEISGPWDSLAATAGSWASESATSAAQMEQAASAWGGLVSSYRDTATEQIVYSALDEAPGVTGQWADVAARASQVLQAIATEASSLEQQALGLRSQAAKLEARLWASDLLPGGGLEGDTSEDQALIQAVHAHNSEVLSLNARWRQVEQQSAADIDEISASGGGYQDEIPSLTADGGGGFGAGGFEVAGLGLGELGTGFQAAVTQMIRSGNDGGTDDPVETAQDLFDQALGEGATGEDVQKFREQIADMSSSEIEEFSDQTPAVHENSIPQPRNEEEYEAWPSGTDGHKWWSDLEDRGLQDTVAESLPLLVGNVAGLPNYVRDAANRDALTRLKNNDEYQGWDKNLTEIERSLKGESEEDMDGGNAESDEPPRMLLSLDIGKREDSSGFGPGAASSSGGWDRQPLAAISVGDPDTADTTTFGVSGMSSGTHQMQNEVRTSERLHRDLERRDDGSHAVVSWLGYDPPPELSLFDNPTSVLRNDRASTGGWDFAYALDGFQETRMAEGNNRSNFTVNVFAHSYGTNMSAHALTRVEHEIDAVAWYGSSGIPESVVEHAGDFDKIATDDEGKPMLFASESDQDSTAGKGRTAFVWGGSRTDPTAEEFGAHEHYSGHPHDGDATNLADVTGHYREGDKPDEAGYLDPGTVHYRNLLHIGVGDYERVLTTEEYAEGLNR